MPHTIGMIHHGRLINEISMEEIEEKHRIYWSLGLTIQKRTAYLLSEELKLLSFRIMEWGNPGSHDKQISPQAISKVLGQMVWKSGSCGKIGDSGRLFSEK